MGSCTVENFLAVPFEQWSIQSLIERTDDESIPFETTLHRDLIALKLADSEKDFQAVFDEAIKPLIELQKKYRQDVDKNNITPKHEVSQEDYTKVMDGVEKYKTKLDVCRWPLPVEGFGIEAILKEAGFEVPKCMGFLETMIQEVTQEEQSSSQ